MSDTGGAAATEIVIGTEDFDVGALYQALREYSDSNGAIVTFVGLVRDISADQAVRGIYLEHYPGMAESEIGRIVEEARQRWPLGKVVVVHRVGQLCPNDQIVFVGSSSAHRQAAFDAAAFIMDYLKTRAPFWKKECTEQGEQWLGVKQTDLRASKRWE